MLIADPYETVFKFFLKKTVKLNNAINYYCSYIIYISYFNYLTEILKFLVLYCYNKGKNNLNFSVE